MKMLYEIYWSAAMIDGEGSFSLRQGTHPSIVVTNTDMEILTHLERLWGGHIYESKHSGVPTRKPCFTWNLNSNQAIGLMMTIYPLMTTRRQKRIREVIAVWKSTRVRIVLRESEALDAMRRVLAGEVLYKVAQSVCIGSGTLQAWMSGRKYPEYLEQLKKEGTIPLSVFDEFALRRVALGRGEKDCPAEEIVPCLRKIRQGAISMNGAARELSVSFHTMKGWATGKYRPYLLAQILQEEQSQQEVDSYACQ